MLKRALLGAIAGLIATVPMTAVMVVLHRFLPPEQRAGLPPEQVVSAVHAKLQDRQPADKLEVGLAHFGFGAFAGSQYFLLLTLMKRIPVIRGPLYGFVVWVVSYFGVLPGARLFPPPNEDSPQRDALMIVAHFVWGGTLQACERLLIRGGDEGNYDR